MEGRRDRERRGSRRRLVGGEFPFFPSFSFHFRTATMDGLIDIEFTQSFIDYAKRSSSTLPESDLFSIKCQFTHLLA